MVGASVAGVLTTSTVSSSSLDSFLPSWVQMTPSAVQSVVAGNTMATAFSAFGVRRDGDFPPDVTGRFQSLRVGSVADGYRKGMVFKRGVA